MKRDIDNIDGSEIDILVIGGGIHGAAIAREVSRSGIKTVLVEKGDFCSGASANSLKIIHGGIRYLQHLNLKRIRESIRSRRRLLAEFPHLVKPLQCIMPTYGNGVKGKTVMRLALLLYDLIGLDRNKGLHPQQKISNGHVVSRQECLELLPGISPENIITGGAIWYDALAINTERLVLSLLHGAAESGALPLNYMEVEKFVVEKGRITAVCVRDVLKGVSCMLKPALVINAAGAWVDMLAGKAAPTPLAGGLAKGINLVVRKNFFSNIAVGLEGTKEFVDKDAFIHKGKRLFFFVPWRGQTMVGTTYSPYKGDPDDFVVMKSDIAAFVDEINEILPSAKLTLQDVSFYHAGLVPIVNDQSVPADEVRLDKHSRVFDEQQRGGLTNLLSVKGVKYTTAIEVAKKVRQKAEEKLCRKSSVQVTPCPKKELYLQAKKYNNIPPHIISEYGADAEKVVRSAENATQLSLISINPPCTEAEILYAVREEMALHLADFLFRRSGIAAAGKPPYDVVKCIAGIMATELEWSPEMIDEEIQAAMAPFAILP